MNNTTGAEPTALSIAVRVSVDRSDFWRTANRGDRNGLRRGRITWRPTFAESVPLPDYHLGYSYR